MDGLYNSSDCLLPDDALDVNTMVDELIHDGRIPNSVFNSVLL